MDDFIDFQIMFTESISDIGRVCQYAGGKLPRIDFAGKAA